MSDARPPIFDENFQTQFEELLIWRRDVRRFRTDPVSDQVLNRLLELAALSPSVGNAQPWRFVKVETPQLRGLVKSSFEKANTKALSGYAGDKAKTYAGLKLSGLDRAPVQLAVFCETDPKEGHGLGRQTMPETLQYSCVAAINTLWLAARAYGLGMGWVSILEPEQLTEPFDVPESWVLIAYLCIGYPEEEHDDPELVRHGWQDRLDPAEVILKR